MPLGGDVWSHIGCSLVVRDQNRVLKGWDDALAPTQSGVPIRAGKHFEVCRFGVDDFEEQAAKRRGFGATGDFKSDFDVDREGGIGECDNPRGIDVNSAVGELSIERDERSSAEQRRVDLNSECCRRGNGSDLGDEEVGDKSGVPCGGRNTGGKRGSKAPVRFETPVAETPVAETPITGAAIEKAPVVVATVDETRVNRPTVAGAAIALSSISNATVDLPRIGGGRSTVVVGACIGGGESKACNLRGNLDVGVAFTTIRSQLPERPGARPKVT